MSPGVRYQGKTGRVCACRARSAMSVSCVGVILQRAAPGSRILRLPDRHLARAAKVRFWLQADLQSPEIDFRLTPNSGHSEAHAGLPRLTRLGSQSLHDRLPYSSTYDDNIIEWASARMAVSASLGSILAWYSAVFRHRLRQIVRLRA